MVTKLTHLAFIKSLFLTLTPYDFIFDDYHVIDPLKGVINAKNEIKYTVRTMDCSKMHQTESNVVPHN